MRIRILLFTVMRIRIRILASKLRLKKAHIPYILACHLQIDEDPDSAYHFDADRDPDPIFQFDVDPSGSGSTTLVSCYLSTYNRSSATSDMCVL